MICCNRNLLIKLFLISVGFFFNNRKIYGQSISAPTIKSPTVSSIDQFGEVPVGLFTGVPDISIPLYTLSYGNISVPISLKYHPASVKPTQHPGWVGLGWSLQSIGSISRSVRGRPDEACCVPNIYNWPAYYPSSDGLSGSERVNVSDWYTKSRLSSYIQNANTLYADVLADEFSFNFMGYSGKFYYGGPSKGWQIVSKDRIKIELNGFLQESQISSIIAQFAPNVGLPGDAQGNQPRAFKGFTLTVPNGTRYVFGGEDAIEFSTPYLSSSAGNSSIKADSWLLRQIIDVYNNVVEFEYRRKYLTCNLSFGHANVSYTSRRLDNSFVNSCGNSSTYGNINARQRSGNLVYPLYISKIKCKNATISFEGSAATCLRYSDWQLWSSNEDAATPPDPGIAFNQYYLNNKRDNIQWEKLDKITITKSNQEVYRLYTFNYNNPSIERLTLNSFEERDKLLNPIKQYQFFYDGISDLPLYDGNKTDHWGFFNNNEVHQQYLNQIYALKQTNTTYVNKGLLTRIKYPTKGYTDFIWEPHDYSQVVSIARDALINSAGIAGGGRIGEIKSFTNTGELALHKKFYYKKNYTNGSNVNSLTSSGVLNGTPKYVFDVTNRLSINENLLLTYRIESFNSQSRYSYNGEGSYIGYDEVAELNADGSYTKHFFTNYGYDINGNSHFDKQPDGFLGWKLGEDVYFPMSSLELERGKPIGAFYYSNSNILLRNEITTYRNDANRFNEFVKLIDLQGPYSCLVFDVVAFMTAFREFSFDYYPIKKEMIQYDQQGNNPIVASTLFSYNANNFISEKVEINSTNEILRTQFKYPSDFTGNSIYQNMVNANILFPIIEEIKLKDYSQTSLTRTDYYSPYAGIYVPQVQKVQIGQGPLQTKLNFNNYDAKGNIRELQKTEDVKEVYLWGYNSQYPVAKIVGSDYTTVSQQIDQTLLDNAANYTDAQVRTELNKIRTNIPNAFVTTYTYSPLTGITSETDPNGKTIYYEYDDFQRLKLVRDVEGNIIKTYNYQYKF